MKVKNFQWKNKQSLAEQLKFFGAKKQGFISVYAKKPRVLCKVKSVKDNDISIGDIGNRGVAMSDVDRQMAAMYSHHTNNNFLSNSQGFQRTQELQDQMMLNRGLGFVRSQLANQQGLATGGCSAAGIFGSFNF